MVKERRTELVEGFRHSVPYINAQRSEDCNSAINIQKCFKRKR